MFSLEVILFGLHLKSCDTSHVIASSQREDVSYLYACCIDMACKERAYNLSGNENEDTFV